MPGKCATFFAGPWVLQRQGPLKGAFTPKWGVKFPLESDPFVYFTSCVHRAVPILA